MTGVRADAPRAAVEIAGTCAWTDYLAAQRAFEQWQRRARLPGWRLLWVALAVEVGVFAGAGLLVDRRWLWGAALALFVAFAIVVRRRVWLPWWFRRAWARERAMREPFRTTVGAAGIRTETTLGAADARWEAFERWLETDALFLVFHSDTQYGLLPKRLVVGADGVARLRAWLEERLGDAA